MRDSEYDICGLLMADSEYHHAACCFRVGPPLRHPWSGTGGGIPRIPPGGLDI
jgi:hypothetical protein